MKVRPYALCSTLLVFLAAPAIGAAETLYVAQSAAGGATGASCSEAKSLATLNTAASWGTGVGKVSPGDTLSFCGVITGQFQVLGSGTAGAVVTITAESGSSFQKTHWTSPAIVASANRSYLRFTGLTINATASGSGQNQGTADAISFTGACDNCEFDHLTITNLYVRQTQGRDTAAPNGIILNELDQASNMDNLSIHHNTFSHALRGVFLIYPSGSSTNYDFSNNTCSQVGTCIWVGSGDVNHTLSGLTIASNSVSDLSPWSGCFNSGCPGDNWHHCDGLVHAYAAHTGSSISGMEVSNNYISGASCVTTELNSSTTTSWIFVEGVGGGTVTGPKVYNNLIANAGPTTDGQIYIKGSTNALVHNNTVVSTTNATGIGCLSSSMTLRNNVLKQSGGPPVYDEGGCSGTSNYNNFNGFSFTNGSWTAGANGTTQAPQLDAAFQLTSASPGKDTGTDVSAACSGCATDRAGVARPQGNGWDMGAFEYRSTANNQPPAPPTNVRIVLP